MIVTVNLNPTLDILCPVDSLLPGKVLRSRMITHYPGGKAFNTARAAAALGAKAVAAGFCGSENLSETLSFLRKYRVIPSLIPVAGRNRYCVIITGRSRETVINSGSSLSISAAIRRRLIAKIGSLSKKCSVMVFSGSLPLCLPAGFYAECIRAVKDKCYVILDASGRDLSEGMKAGPDAVKINYSELKTVSKGLAPRKTAVMLCKKYGISTFITTLGKKGSLLYDSGRFVFIPAARIKKAVSGVGCGDAYTAGLAFGIEKGMDMHAACVIASATAAAGLKRHGACFFKKSEVRL